MKKIPIIENNVIKKKTIDQSLEKQHKKNITNIIKNIILNLKKKNNPFYSLSRNFKLNFKLSNLNKFKRFNTVVIIGMGGSSLGIEAIYNFLNIKIKKKFIFFNDLDQTKLSELKKKNLNKILFLVISKSGETLETFINLFSLPILKNNNNIIIISEKSNNTLHMLAKKYDLLHIEHRKYIGGRYSVLSEIGMLPAYLMGLNIREFRKNLLNYLESSQRKILINNSIKIANLLERKKINNIIFLNYSSKMEKSLLWLQQLIAESLGKKGKGFMPSISNMPKDNHSLLQLYLDGPRDKIFYVFSEIIKKDKKISSIHLPKKMSFLKAKTISKIKKAQKDSLINIFKIKGIPFREIKIKDFNERTLGEFFSYFMLETVLVGKLSKIDPFNQPSVEIVKKKTRQLII